MALRGQAPQPCTSRRGQVASHHPSLCCGDPQGAPEPCEVAIARVRTVLALIWKQMRQRHFEGALGRGKREDGAMPPVPCFLPVSRRRSGWGFAAGSLRWPFVLCVAGGGGVIPSSPRERLHGTIAPRQVMQRSRAAIWVLLLAAPSCPVGTAASLLPSRCLSCTRACPLYHSNIYFTAWFSYRRVSGRAVAVAAYL